jgi:hypothetical protein
MLLSDKLLEEITKMPGRALRHVACYRGHRLIYLEEITKMPGRALRRFAADAACL